MQKKTYKIKGMDCESCAAVIEMDLEDIGIKASCSYVKGELKAELKSNQDEKKMKEVIQKSGYQVI